METQKTSVPVLVIIAVAALIIGPAELVWGGGSAFGAIATGAGVGILSSKAFHAFRVKNQEV